MDIAIKIAQEKIKEAMENGEFDNLPGRGKPIDLSDYFKSPPHLRMTFYILKKSGVLPDEVKLLKEIQQLKEKSVCNAEEQAKLNIEINYKTAQLKMMMEKYHRKR